MTTSVQPNHPEPGRKPGPTEDEKLLNIPVDNETMRIRRNSDSWRVLRIMGEFTWGFENLQDVAGGVSIFGSARTRPDDPYYKAAEEMAALFARSGVPVITGGGPGIMEAANKGAFEAGGISIGCNIELPHEQSSNAYLNRSLDFKFFFVRKVMFVKYAMGFIVFPGGFGTLDELFEALTLIQTDKVTDFPVVLFGSEYWQGLGEWLNKEVLRRGMISPGDEQMVTITDDIYEAVRIFQMCRRRLDLDVVEP